MAKYKPGQSGNPNGRPKGSGQAATLRKAIAEDMPDIINALAEKAKAGDTAAAKLLIDRAIPAYKAEAAPVVLSASSEGLTERASEILDAAAAGNLPPDTAAQLVAAVGKLARLVKVDELEQRIATLEDESNG